MRKFIKVSLYAVGILLLTAFGVNFWMILQTQDRIYTDDSIPTRKVGVILGTSKSHDGGPNQYFQERVETAARLYKAGKVSHLIVSGDNRSVYYNEPRDMYNALLKLGVPGKSITMDYAGLRTFDSIVRAKLIFGQDRITVITQGFHCYRALFIADYYEMDAVAYAAGGDQKHSLGLALRELVARNLAALDLYIFHQKPEIMGKKELIP